MNRREALAAVFLTPAAVVLPVAEAPKVVHITLDTEMICRDVVRRITENYADSQSKLRLAMETHGE